MAKNGDLRLATHNRNPRSAMRYIKPGAEAVTEVTADADHPRVPRFVTLSVQASARVTITDDAVEVRFGKRVHNPYLLDAGLADTDVAVPWWERRRLRLAFS